MNLAIQPAIGVALQPKVGASPITWAVVQFAFQLLLLLGYVCAGRLPYSPWLSKRGVAICLLAVAGITLVTPSIILNLSASDSTAKVILPILFEFGLPFVTLSTFSVGAQLLLAQEGSSDPTWLYAVSAAGSVMSLVAYPLAIEPLTDVATQISTWHIAVTVLVGLSGLMLLTSTQGDVVHNEGPMVAQGRTATAREFLTWTWIGYGPVASVLAITAYMALDLGSHPIVWLAPLSSYMLILGLSFTSPGSQVVSLAARAAPLAIYTGVISMLRPWFSGMSLLIWHCTLLIFVLASWNRWLIAVKPTSSRSLPLFFVAIALGGVLASGSMAWLVPVVFDPSRYAAAGAAGATLWGSLAPEYIILLLSACTSLRFSEQNSKVVRLAEACILGLASAYAGRRVVTEFQEQTFTLFGLLGCVLLIAFVLRVHSRLSTLLATVTAISVLVYPVDSTKILYRGRSFWGHLLVTETLEDRRLRHGTTLHGVQSLNCIVGQNSVACAEPASYYARSGPLGVAFGKLRATRPALDVVAVGLGVGTVASYCSGPDTVRFVEIDPRVVYVAEQYFAFLASARKRCASVRVDVGDARRVLSHYPPKSADLLVSDAFSSDSVPQHLLTREAIGDMSILLRDGGIAALHVSSRYFELAEVAAAAGRAVSLEHIIVRDRGGEHRAASVWVFLTRNLVLARELLTSLRSSSFTIGTLDRAQSPWTDGRHSLLRSLR